MFAVSLLFKNGNLCLSQNFKAFKNADDLYNKIHNAITHRTNEIIDSEDDYQSKFVVNSQEIFCVSFTDITEDMKKSGDLQIIQTRQQLKTNNESSHDGQIKLLQTTTSGLKI